MIGNVVDFYFEELDTNVWMAGLPWHDAAGTFKFGEPDQDGIKCTFTPHGFMRPQYDVGETLEFNNCLIQQEGKWGPSLGGDSMYPWLNSGGISFHRTISMSQGWTHVLRYPAAISDSFFENWFGFQVFFYDQDFVDCVDNTMLYLDLIGSWGGLRVYRNTVTQDHGGIRVGNVAGDPYSYHLIDVAFPNTGHPEKNVPIVQWYREDPAYNYPTIRLYNTIAIKLVDVTGAAIDGTVTVTDGDGDSTDYPTTSGSVEFEVERGYVYFDVTKSTPEYDETLFYDKNPMQISIDAGEEYQPYSTILTLDEPTDWTIAMQPAGAVQAQGITATIEGDFVVEV
jgi:hypothetical protein